MTDEHKQEIISSVTNNILNALMKQSFKEWHDGRFEAFVVGDLMNEFGTENHLIAETLIKQDIQRLFNIV